MTPEQRPQRDGREGVRQLSQRDEIRANIYRRSDVWSRSGRGVADGGRGVQDSLTFENRRGRPPQKLWVFRYLFEAYKISHLPTF